MDYDKFEPTRSRRELVDSLENRGLSPKKAIQALLLREGETDLNEYQKSYKDKIVAAGYNPSELLDALVDESYYVISQRIADIQHGTPVNGSQPMEIREGRMINSVAKFGFDPFDLDKLIETREKLFELKTKRLE